MLELLELLKEHGPTLAVLIFVIWRSERREKDLTEAKAESDEFIRTKLVDLTSTVNTALTNNTRVNNSVVQALGARPCIAREMGMVDTEDMHG